ncbi:hypothetical protein HK104_011322, partial [Borealophlyctis nickersoniae]
MPSGGRDNAPPSESRESTPSSTSSPHVHRHSTPTRTRRRQFFSLAPLLPASLVNRASSFSSSSRDSADPTSRTRTRSEESDSTNQLGFDRPGVQRVVDQPSRVLHRLRSAHSLREASARPSEIERDDESFVLRGAPELESAPLSQPEQRQYPFSDSDFSEPSSAAMEDTISVEAREESPMPPLEDDTGLPPLQDYTESAPSPFIPILSEGSTSEPINSWDAAMNEALNRTFLPRPQNGSQRQSPPMESPVSAEGSSSGWESMDVDEEPINSL